MQVGSLGDVVFETSASRVLTPSSFEFSSSARFEDHEVHGAKQRTEFLGPDLCEFDMDITVHRSLGVEPEQVLVQLGGYCQQGTVARLIVAGKNICRCTVREVSTTWRHLAPGGNGVLAMDLKLKLKEYR